jgi:hypothetical protein
MSGTADESEMTCRQLQAMAEPKRLSWHFGAWLRSINSK